MNANRTELLVAVRNGIVDEYQKQITTAQNAAVALLEAYNRLEAEGIKLPELDVYTLRWGFCVEVTSPSQWKGIHKALGKLELNNKEPILNDKDKPTGEIWLTLVPEAPAIGWRIRVRTRRKLKKSDPCRVRVVRSKSVQVVCEVPTGGRS
jgi:hypothetical protein